MLKLKLSKDAILLVIIEASVKKFETINRKLQQQLYRDIVTGLYNRKFLLKRGDALLNEGYNTLAVIDVRNLRAYNEIFGHDTTDKILRKIAEKIKELCSDTCIIGSLDAGRFWLLSSIDDIEREEIAKKSIENIIKHLTTEELRVNINDEDLIILIALSAGIAFYPEHGKNIAELLRAAEIAADRAKAEKINTYSVFDITYKKLIEENIWIEEQLRKAIKGGKIEKQIYPVFQIKVNPSTEKITGVEVLMRWRLYPQIYRIINVAEKTGLINDLFKILIRQAIPYMREALKINPDIHFGFNISPYQLALKDDLLEALDLFIEEKCEVEKVELEITESELLKNIDAEQILNTLTEKGFKLIIDDFGKGYSSFDRIKRWNIHGVKIDKSLIDDIPEGVKRYGKTYKGFLFLKNLTEFLKNMNYKITFEGIEDEFTVNLVKELGIDEVQGYYYAKPVDGNRFIECLKNWEEERRCFPLQG